MASSVRFRALAAIVAGGALIAAAQPAAAKGFMESLFGGSEPAVSAPNPAPAAAMPERRSGAALAPVANAAALKRAALARAQANAAKIARARLVRLSKAVALASPSSDPAPVSLKPVAMAPSASVLAKLNEAPSDAVACRPAAALTAQAAPAIVARPAPAAKTGPGYANGVPINALD